jgi:molecular chaperone DnaK
MDRIFGIDLGTTNSVIAYTDPTGTTEVIAGRDGGRIVPSVVYFPDKGDPVVGTLAREHAITEPERVARLFKRGMGEQTFLPDGKPFVVDGHTWAPEELSALVLRKLAQMAAEQYGEPVRRVVITVPAYFGEVERAATKSAGVIAGLDVVRIVDEPVAAAVAHGLDHPADAGTILVFDLGGGTFDVTVMHVAANGDMRVVAKGGDRQLGGMDFDELIVGRMITTAREGGLDIETEAWARQDAYAKAEEIKKKLSFTEVAGDSLTGSGRPLRFDLSRGELESLLANRLREVEDTTIYTLEEAAGLRPADLSNIIMVGGSSRIPAFQRLLSRIYHGEPSFTRNLDEDVARGAAMLAAKEGGQLDPRTQLAQMAELETVVAHGIGITSTDDVTRQQSNALIVAANARIPAEDVGTFVTIDEGQTMVEVHLNEGDEEDLEYVREIAIGPAEFGRPVPKGYPMNVRVTINDEGLVEFTGWDAETGKKIAYIPVVRPSILSQQQVEQARSRNASYKEIG